jgi:hypothetical protein
LERHKDWLGDIKLPLPSEICPKNGTKGNFQWKKPKSVTEIGSWCLKTPISKLSALDIVLEMPVVSKGFKYLIPNCKHLANPIP